RHRHMWCGLVRAQDIVELQLDVYRHIDRLDRSEVERRPERSAFGTRAIVPANIDDQGVIELAHVFDGLNDATNLMVRVGDISAEYFRLMGINLLLQGREGFVFGR